MTIQCRCPWPLPLDRSRGRCHQLGDHVSVEPPTNNGIESTEVSTIVSSGGSERSETPVSGPIIPVAASGSSESSVIFLIGVT